MKYPVLKYIRGKRTYKALSVFMILNLLVQTFAPTVAFALTSGPGQEEYASFEPVETTEMVDPYSGDFTYNLPLLSVPGPNGGYPINLAYHSGIGMDQEASWTGLGWNISVGAINRQMRGLPDDLKGNAVQQLYHLKPTESFSLDIPTSKERELYGFPLGPEEPATTLSTAQIYYNNYKGIGYRVVLTPKRLSVNLGFATASVGLSIDSQNGIGINPGFNMSGFLGKCENGVGFGVSASTSINSRNGLQSYNFSGSLGVGRDYAGVKGYNKKTGETIDAYKQSGTDASISLPYSSFVPPTQIPMYTISKQLQLKVAYGKDATTLVNNVQAIVPYKVKFKRWGTWSGYYERNEVRDNGPVSIPAYGFMNTPIGQGVYKDFNREPITYSKKIPNLAPSTYTYDLFSIAGQGTGGMFRSYRSGIDVLTNPTVKSTKDIKILNAEIGMATPPTTTPPSTTGLMAHIGFGVPQGTGDDRSGGWHFGQNDISTALVKPTNPEFEPSYFQMYGEKAGVYDSPNASGVYENPLNSTNGWQGDQPLRVKIDKTSPWGSKEFIATSEFIPYEGGGTLYNSNGGAHNYEANRKRRATNIETLTYSQASKYGLTAKMQYKDASNNSQPFFYPGNAVSANDQLIQNQIAEITVHQPDGMRYIYGLPAVNRFHENASFRIEYDQSNSPVASQSGLEEHNVSLIANSTWNNGTDITQQGGSTNNPLDEYISQTNLPPYANSWLLTYVVSSDYVDVTGDGPSNDDLGYWVKFNYVKQYSNYRWRVPYTDANYIPGSIDNPQDNMATYSYGEKEVFYLESVETKTHRAVFTTSLRKDGYDSDANGKFATTRGTNATKKIDKIELFAKGNIVPIKTVHFEYDYSLCGGVPNNDGTSAGIDPSTGQDRNINRGKLTLKKLWFTYNNSTRGELSPYKFTYTDSKTYDNPSYNIRDIDRWGNFSPNSEFSANVNQYYPYIRFPYTQQKQISGLEAADKYAQAWLLKKIDLPSGGSINIEYEADDYSYVEDQKALQMYDIRGLGASPPTNSLSGREDIYTFSNDNTVHNFTSGSGPYKVYFELEKNITDPNPSQYLFDHYLRGMSKVYFNVEINLKDNNDPHFDNVSGYAEIDFSDYGVTTVSGIDYGYIALKEVPIRDPALSGKKIHPFMKAAFAHLRANRSELIYGAGNTVVNFQSLVSFVPDIKTMIVGFNRFCLKKGWGTDVRLNGRSVIRLLAPDDKHGGGVRVKKLFVEESGFSTGSPISKYGQVYDYTIEENGQKISSGVAYEPQIGNEESALKQPIDYVKSTPFKADQNLFLETPLLENYYPGQQVGYRKVTIKSLARADAEANVNPSEDICVASPVIVYEFYTGKDFPVLYDETDMSADPAIIRPLIIPGILSKLRKSQARSQGYSLVLNDMAGKLKSLTTLIPKDATPNSQDKILSHEKYIYNTVNPYAPNAANKLYNKVMVIKDQFNQGGTQCALATLGESSDIFVDMDENSSFNTSQGTYWNFGIQVTLPGTPLPAVPNLPPYVLPIPLPFYSEFETSFRTAVTTKIIYRTGILKQVEKFDGQARVITENLAYDIETGKPILTKVINEFEDNIFTLDFPGHWYYSGMQSSYKNFGVTISSLSGSPNSSGQYSLSSGYPVADLFHEGDELWLTGSSNKKAYVLSINSTSPNNYIQLIDDNGVFVTSSINKIEVARSGYRNLSSISVGSILTNIDPSPTLCGICTTNVVGPDPQPLNAPQVPCNAFVNVIRSSAVRFSDEWKTNCNEASTGVGCTAIPTTINPYRNGMKGIWRPFETYAFVEQRNQQNDIRRDGTYMLFKFPWENPTLVTNPAPNSGYAKWRLANRITKYSPFGYEIENEDALNNFSAALYGYGNSLVTAVAANARYNEMLFDGFEDYSINNLCNDVHWSFTKTIPLSAISNLEAHTGKSSFQISSHGSPISQTMEVPVGFVCSNTSSANYLVTPGLGVQLAGCGCNGRFQPEAGITGKDYIVSLWVKQVLPASFSSLVVTSYTLPKVTIDFLDNFNSSVGQYILTPQSSNKIIEGWQRIFEKINVPPQASKMQFTFTNQVLSYPGAKVYFDDIRIHPTDANMKSFVYDTQTFKQVAELDANNYATFYVYDDEGLLSKTKKETSAGIKTISEGRTGTVQQ